VSATLVFSSVCLVAGGLLLTMHALSRRRPSLQVRLARSEGQAATQPADGLAGELPESVQLWGQSVLAGYEERLHRAGRDESARLFACKKLLLAFAVPFVPGLPYLAATHHLPSLVLLFALAILGFFVPDLVLRNEAVQRREAIFLDLPEAVSIMAISLHAGQSLRQALELAARDCEGPLGDELAGALSLSRRDRSLGEREALVVVAKDTGEPAFVRFAELLAAKESPYLEFLRGQAQELRSEQNRFLERAADRAYLAMHAPVAPLIAVLVLVLAYGFIHFLTQTI
jgi:Type II secretion system (T2SS), protein F